jgi:hypothetical protein
MRKNYTELNTNGERRERITGLTSERFSATLMNPIADDSRENEITILLAGSNGPAITTN